MERALSIGNDAVRFFVELAFVVVFAWFGWWLGDSGVGDSAVVGVLLAVVFVAVGVTFWALLAAPRRRFATPGWVPGAMFLLYGALSAGALVVVGRPKLAVLLAVLVVANESARLLGLEAVNREDGRG